MRRVPMLLAIVALLAAALPATAPAATRSCPHSDPDNGLDQLRAGGISCGKAFRVAKRTNSVKCFLNGNRCTHRYRGRSWTCRLDDETMRVTCRSGDRVVRYRLG